MIRNIIIYLLKKFKINIYSIEWKENNVNWDNCNVSSMREFEKFLKNSLIQSYSKCDKKTCDKLEKMLFEIKDFIEKKY